MSVKKVNLGKNSADLAIAKGEKYTEIVEKN